MIDVESILRETYPDLKWNKNHKWQIKLLKKLLHEDDFNQFIAKNRHLKGFAFLDQLLNHFNFSYTINSNEINNIPAEGRVLIVANHPIGTLDGLALLKLVRSIRPDVRIVANRVLSSMEPLRSVFLEVDVLTRPQSLKKAAYQSMQAALQNEEAVIIFPAGEVSRLTPQGVRDDKWKSGFVKLAYKTRSPVLPIHINASNSALFYAVSMLYKPLSTLLLVEEMFNKPGQEIKFTIGEQIPYQAFDPKQLKPKELSQRCRKHVQNLAKKNKKALFPVTTTIAHPANSKAIKKELFQSERLGETRDGKTIFLYPFRDDSPVMHEIARLRELTFRTVEEGTGLDKDFDGYDRYYRHLVLWDNQDLEIVGAYRIGEGQSIMQSYGVEGFYTHTLFDLNPAFQAYLPYSIELGRSFVQPRYWGQRSLDYLWYGIGAYLRDRPEIKYLFGPVSLSNAYPLQAKEFIISFYKQQFGCTQDWAAAKEPFVISEAAQAFAQHQFNQDYKTSFAVLNQELKKLGVKVPVLYKQYVELCQDNGCHFIDFNRDQNFSDCIDSLIMVELDKIAPQKRQRYIETRLTH